MSKTAVRPLLGLVTVALLVGIVAFSIGMFAGGFGQTVPVTVLSERAGLVMNPQAEVRLRGVQVGTVEDIESRANGQAALKLAMDPSQLRYIPSNVLADISSPTVFGGKNIELVVPGDPSAQTLRPGAEIPTQNVTVEINTVFQQLTTVLDKIDPVKLNETLGAVRSAVDGRGEKLGQTVTDLESFLERIEPSLGNLNRDLEVAPVALNAFGDAAPDLVRILDNTTDISRTLVDQEQNLDAFLVSAIGLADVGNEVVGGNRAALTDVLRLLVPTTDLSSEYWEALRCGLQGLIPFTKSPPLPEPGALLAASFTLGIDRYRYPGDLPKVAATGGPKCTEMMLPEVPTGEIPPFLVTDIGANPWEYGNQGLLANSDGLKEALFGPIDGPPRNSAQVGQPG